MADEPVLVYVCRIMDPEAVRRGLIREDDVKLVAWAEVAKSMDLLPTAANKNL